MTATTRTRSDPRARLLHGTAIAEQIRNYIATNHLQAGDQLPSESEFADSYGVSSRVVHEALHELAHQSVIRTHQGKRAIVADLRPAALYQYFLAVLDHHSGARNDVIELRKALEVTAAGLAVTRITADELKVLKRSYDDPVNFHTAILHSAHNRFITDVVESLTAAARQHDVPTQSSAAASPYYGCPTHHMHEDHRAIFGSIMQRNRAATEHLMQQHLQ